MAYVPGINHAQSRYSFPLSLPLKEVGNRIFCGIYKVSCVMKTCSWSFLLERMAVASTEVFRVRATSFVFLIPIFWDLRRVWILLGKNGRKFMNVSFRKHLPSGIDRKSPALRIARLWLRMPASRCFRKRTLILDINIWDKLSLSYLLLRGFTCRQARSLN
jgi:hypothetical protein